MTIETLPTWYRADQARPQNPIEKFISEFEAERDETYWRELFIRALNYYKYEHVERHPDDDLGDLPASCACEVGEPCESCQ